MLPHAYWGLYGQTAGKPSGIRQMFSPQEDETLKQLVSQYGDKDWKLIARKMPNRSTRQCRERYKNYLAPEIKNGPWTREEDELLRSKYQEFGPRWSTIATFFESRSDVNIKNRWTSISGHQSKAPKMKAYFISTSPPNQVNSIPNNPINLNPTSNGIVNNSSNMNGSSLINKFNGTIQKVHQNGSQNASPANANIGSSPSMTVEKSPLSPFAIQPQLQSIQQQIQQTIQQQTSINQQVPINVQSNSNAFGECPPISQIHQTHPIITRPAPQSVPPTDGTVNSLPGSGNFIQQPQLSNPMLPPNGSQFLMSHVSHHTPTSTASPQIQSQTKTVIPSQLQPVQTPAQVHPTTPIDQPIPSPIPPQEIPESAPPVSSNTTTNTTTSNPSNPATATQPAKRKQLFPPISSFSQTADSTFDRVVFPNESSRIDESYIGNGPNMALTNTFPNYGGSIW
ncbi:hypothetical protein TRFO_37767 [Tritrichomonas foetus]|uniref:Myb-like DNA-binding domain containing protein n=1 Tax=Tritrichomonas foetus TaxID=1144522 RepID=A0A1J4JAC2_9EUKA|nr:hypothetical protein TRFO_37767 [Tritrichomonas foetus]|eukprot:OHS96096.1 hypothetical protein TRFO_37767 [Tritrichomonas foetus]